MRLNRVLYNLDCLNVSNFVTCKSLIRNNSDYHPILLTLFNVAKRGKSSFKFAFFVWKRGTIEKNKCNLTSIKLWL